MRPALAAFCLFVALAAPAQAQGPRTVAPGVELLTTPTPGAETFAVRLDLLLGLDAEGEGSWGLAALSLASLWDGATARLAVGDALATSLRSGIHTDVALHRDRISVTLSGPTVALGVALWLTAERLEPRELQPAALQQLHTRMLARPDTAVPPPSPPLQHTFSNLYGPLAGHTAHASHQRAGTEPIEPLAAMVADALARARARVMVAASPAALARAIPSLARELATTRTRPGGPPARRDLALDEDWLARRPTRVVAKQDHDSRRLLAVAWDLRQTEADHSRELALRRLAVTLLGDPGGLLTEPLIAAHGVARDLVVLAPTLPPTLVLVAAVRGRATSDARTRLLSALAPLTDGTLSPRLFEGAARRAAQQLQTAWGGPTRRLALISEWWSAGALSSDPAADLEAQLTSLSALRRADLARWAGDALHETRRVIVELTPSQLPDQERVVLDAETLYDYLRLLVDLRCPPRDRTLQLVELLATKYGMSPEQYIALTRVVAQDPGRMRELNHEAEQRCLEYKKLRSMMKSARIVALHRAVACDAGGLAADDERATMVTAIYKRFDIDPSVYRPLVMLAREDPPLASLLGEIDAECPAAFGPAARL